MCLRSVTDTTYSVRKRRGGLWCDPRSASPSCVYANAGKGVRYTNKLIQAVVTAHQVDPLSQLPFLQLPGMLFLVALLESNQATGFFQSKSGIQQGIYQ